MDSPGSTRSFIHFADSTVQDGNGLNRRERNFSGGSLSIPPFEKKFTQKALEDYFQNFLKLKIRKSKIYQHLVGYQIFKMEEIPNYPEINTKSHDTGWTALHWACDAGEKELVELLLNNCNADSSVKNNSGSSPIHLAVTKGHSKVVECLLSKKPSLVNSLNEKNGWYPIHTAAYFRQTECLKVLIQFGASVLQITEKIPSLETLYTPFHLATYAQIKRRLTVIKSPTEITRNLIRSISSPKEQEDEEDEEQAKIHEFLDVLLENLPDGELDVMYVGSHGSILHCLAASNHSAGVELICDRPYCHPPDTPNSEGVTPLLMALELRALDSALVLLDYQVDILAIHPRHKMTALQLLLQKASSIKDIHLSIVDKLLERGADPTYSSPDGEDSALTIATTTNLDVRLMERFLNYLDEKTINVKDQLTGDTVLHYAVANCSSAIIEIILGKGADVMIENSRNVYDYETSSRMTDSTSDLPLQVAITNKKSKSYFDALTNYGFHKILERYTSAGKQDKVINFLKTHLSGCSKEMHKDLFLDIYHFLTEGSTNGDAKISAPNEAELNHIIHYKSKCKAGTIFGKTALNWANENNDKATALELLKLEKNIHHSKQCGLECLKDSLSSDALLPWIIETYQSFYDKTTGFLRLTAAITVFFELVLFSYMPFLYDFYSDVTLALNYSSIAFSNDSEIQDSLWNCSYKRLNSTCFVETQTMDISNLFAIAFWVTVATVIMSTLIYFWVIFKHSDPQCIINLENKMYDLGSSKNLNPTLVKIFAKSTRLFLSSLAKLLWPIVHIVRKYRYNASPKRSDHKALTTESDDTWHTIKTVEYGIESSVQLCLQTWLLKPFFAEITRWESQELVIRSVHGIMNFMTFNTYPACYIERALGKILLTVISLALGVALMKSTKPGMGACERPLRTLPILFSILAQTVARIFAFRSLILIESGIHLMKYVIFLIIHFVLLFTIKILFEIRVPKTRDRRASFMDMCSSPQKNKPTMLNIGKFIISGLASTIIMVSIHEENRAMRRQKFSFLPHSLFFSLILVENLILVLLPYLAPSLYPSQGCFPADSHANGVICVVVLWFVGVAFQIGHYKWSHPWAELNGPKKSDSRWEFVTRLCWKSELQTISFAAAGRLQRRDHERRCTEIEALVLEYESRKHSRAFNGNGPQANGYELVPLKSNGLSQASPDSSVSV